MKLSIGELWIGSLILSWTSGYQMAAGGPTEITRMISLFGFVEILIYGYISLWVYVRKNNRGIEF